MGCVLALDVGLRRTGVAVGHTLTGTAKPCTTLTADRGRLNWDQFDQLIKEWQPERVVIGDPQTDDPHLNKLINRIKSHIQQNHKLPIHGMDERLSSSAANAELADHGLNAAKKQALRDQVAACLILESYFHSLSD
ncbi:putative pre-16S rRNA nuclease [Arenicella chitinivorans]|uniref:Putative pre-16S rRNA nuclease n=1 Tax=Arenicella chitinivorans TaxID=1329800 RepID=A0A918RM57_9GAMM|nr:Holliday junction resolvase RuvX [Arenicella chitinivorans]GHA05204.1 putative pre-16S rRNA nuclease [Arenicella chitinivorans]